MCRGSECQKLSSTKSCWHQMSGQIMIFFTCSLIGRIIYLVTFRGTVFQYLLMIERHIRDFPLFLNYKCDCVQKVSLFSQKSAHSFECAVKSSVILTCLRCVSCSLPCNPTEGALDLLHVIWTYQQTKITLMLWLCSSLLPRSQGEVFSLLILSNQQRLFIYCHKWQRTWLEPANVSHLV